MKGLRKYLTPFAPDQSGAVSLLYELGGLIIILDAGGCAGNICGFDEPRWFEKRSAIFSAGLRDMDAILGRDELLISKIKDVVKDIDASFIALIGTPVPAVIGTDYLGIKRILEKETSLPVIYTNTNGVELYDKGIEKALLSVVKTFSSDDVLDNSIGLLGLTPLDFPLEEINKIVSYYKQYYKHVLTFNTLEDYKHIGGLDKIIPMTPACKKSIRYLNRHYSIKLEALYLDTQYDFEDKDVLIIHQDYIVQAIKNKIKAKNVVTATFFMSENSIQLKEEDDLIKLLDYHYDVVMADKALQSIVPNYKGQWIDLSHFAVSGT